MFPTIKDLASALTANKRWCESGDQGGIDVRLQVQEGGWALRTGDSSYDLDHRGYWGAGYLTRSSNCRELARELIEEARDHAAQCAE